MSRATVGIDGSRNPNRPAKHLEHLQVSNNRFAARAYDISNIVFFATPTILHGASASPMRVVCACRLEKPQPFAAPVSVYSVYRRETVYWDCLPPSRMGQCDPQRVFNIYTNHTTTTLTTKAVACDKFCTKVLCFLSPANSVNCHGCTGMNMLDTYRGMSMRSTYRHSEYSAGHS